MFTHAKNYILQRVAETTISLQNYKSQNTQEI